MALRHLYWWMSAVILYQLSIAPRSRYQIVTPCNHGPHMFPRPYVIDSRPFDIHADGVLMTHFTHPNFYLQLRLLHWHTHRSRRPNHSQDLFAGRSKQTFNRSAKTYVDDLIGIYRVMRRKDSLSLNCRGEEYSYQPCPSFEHKWPRSAGRANIYVREAAVSHSKGTAIIRETMLAANREPVQKSARRLLQMLSVIQKTQSLAEQPAHVTIQCSSPPWLYIEPEIA